MDRMAANDTIHSGRLRMAMPTRWPFWTPNMCTSVCARASMCRWVSWNDQRSSSKTRNVDSSSREAAKTSTRVVGAFLKTR